MAAWNPQANDIFLKAVEIQSLDDRRTYLDEACRADAQLRGQVEALIRAGQQAGSFLESPAPGVTAAVDSSELGEQPGSVIGPYKLLQKLGEGGMGTVWMAEQTQPVQRKVALKVIKPGMDSRQIIARFEAERQALALMDHVNIARVLDAGTTESGLPYFVMELVHGVPITQYCDDNHLTPRERLELFVPVCQALQHAHQKGIIHRDIKPSNVMITLYDGRPVPKVIDFGVAKATEQKLTERTLFTQYGTMVGTLEYMSPEQAEMSALGVDTRSDIFSLGVLLYELLTGSTPLSQKRLREAAYGEILRMIKEEEPPKPSTRLSESGEALASISAQRHMEPAKLTKLMRGELDWIVMKTLEKDRNRRYETASGFAADVERYLHDDPVLACPPSARYRLLKFLRRNKGPVLAVVLVILALLGAVVGTTWGLVRAGQALDAEAEQRQAAEKSRQLADRQRELALKTLNSVVFNIQTKLAFVPGAQAVRRTLISTAVEGLMQVARSLDTAAEADHALVWSHLDLGDVFLLAGDPKGGGTEEARKQFQIAHELAEKLAHEIPLNTEIQRDLSVTYQKVGDVNLRLGKTAVARDLYQKSLEISQKLANDDPKNAKAQRDLADGYVRLGDMNLQLGNTAAARDAYQKCLEISQKLAHDDPQNAEAQRHVTLSRQRLGGADLQMGNLSAAHDEYQKCVEISQKLAHDDPQNAEAQRDLCVSYSSLGDVNLQMRNAAATRDAYQKCLEIGQKLAHDDPQNAQARRDLSVTYSKLGDVNYLFGDAAPALNAYQECLGIIQKLAHDDPQNADAQRDLLVSNLKVGDVNLRLGNAAATRDAYQKCLEISQKLAHDDPQNAEAQRNLAVVYLRFGVVSLQLDNRPAARDAFQKSLEIKQRLAHDDPQSALAQTDLANGFGRLGHLEMESEDFSAATRWFAQGVAIFEKLNQNGRIANQPQFLQELAAQRKALESCQAAERAIDDLDFALGRPKQELPDRLGIRSRALARRGRHADAASTAERLAALEPASGANLYQAAQGYALCAAGMKPASPQTQLSAEEQALQERYSARAVELLKQSDAAGYFKDPEQRAAFERDRNLDALRSRDDFKKLRAEILASSAEKR